MNLADYLSELLGMQDEVHVPGLGYFVRMRVNALYDDSEARFYPPYHQVKFVQQATEDETFAQYVADAKNISLASSKYFVEKFINKLREDASTGKYLFADLGAFQMDLGQLVFKPNDRIPADPAFYGYPLVNLLKVGQPISYDTKQPEFAQTQTVAIAQPAAAVAVPAQTVAQPEYYEDEVERKRGISIWLIILFSLAVLALAVFGVYKFYPSAFDKVTDEYHKITGKTADSPAVKHEVKKDTPKKVVPVKDSLVKDSIAKAMAAAAPKDTVKPIRYEIIANSFRQMGWANAEVKRLQKLGISAKVLTDAPGPRLKVSAGTFSTVDSAETARVELVKERKIPNNSKVLPLKTQ